MDVAMSITEAFMATFWLSHCLISSPVFVNYNTERPAFVFLDLLLSLDVTDDIFQKRESDNF